MTKKIIKDNKNPKKEATINDLMVVVSNLSERMDKRFEEQEIRLEKMMDEKIEGLAVMVNKSFESVEIKLGKMATKDDVNLLREDMNDKFGKVNNSIEKISIKMDNLADVVYADHRPRIISLENRTQKLEASR